MPSASVMQKMIPKTRSTLPILFWPPASRFYQWERVAVERVANIRPSLVEGNRRAQGNKGTAEVFANPGLPRAVRDAPKGVPPGAGLVSSRGAEQAGAWLIALLRARAMPT